ncbi:hypothetical protein AGLY_017668, partial [Aphis glycines]
MQESVTLSLSGNTTTLSVHYCPPIDVYDDSEIALLNLQTYNTFANINETNNNFEIYLENSDRLLNNNKFPICSITLKKGCYDIKDIKNQILTQIDDFNNDNDYFGIKSTEKITFDIGIDQIDFRTTIFSNGIIRFNENNSIGPLLWFEKKIVMNYACTLMVIDHRNRIPKSNILDISSPFETDSKITKIEYHSYTPYTTSFNNNDEIRISIQQTDVYPYLNESFIYLEGQVSDAGKVKLTNNGFSYLFDQIRLKINGIEVDSTRVLGITSSLKGYLSGTPDNYNCYENAGWIFNYSSNPANNNGEFSACIPLKYWLGLFEDFKKILVNSRLELILTRFHSDLNALKVITSARTNSGKVVLNKIIWKVPHITVDDEERLKLLKLIEKEKSLFIPFRSFETFEYPELGTTKKVVWNLKTASKLEKPRFIIIGLQKGRKNSLEKDCSIFDHYFTKNNFTLLYDMYTSFQESYYEKNIQNPILSPSTFLSNAPIVVIDTSKQNDSATASSVDVQLEIEASESLTGVTAYCLLNHDRIVEYIPFTRE